MKAEQQVGIGLIGAGVVFVAGGVGMIYGSYKLLETDRWVSAVALRVLSRVPLTLGVCGIFLGGKILIDS